jgi:hypothetical protein
MTMTDTDKDAIPLPDESARAKARPDGGDDKPSTADLVRQAAGNGNAQGAEHGRIAETTVRGEPDPGPEDAKPLGAAPSTAAIAHPEAQKAPKADDSKDEETAPLFAHDEATRLQARWDTIQVGFVDEPRKAVEDADALVAATMQRLAEMFADERARLEGQWARGDDVSTEDLRVALRRYRAFFGRLLTI